MTGDRHWWKLHCWQLYCLARWNTKLNIKPNSSTPPPHLPTPTKWSKEACSCYHNLRTGKCVSLLRNFINDINIIAQYIVSLTKLFCHLFQPCRSRNGQVSTGPDERKGSLVAWHCHLHHCKTKVNKITKIGGALITPSHHLHDLL